MFTKYISTKTETIFKKLYYVICFLNQNNHKIYYIKIVIYYFKIRLQYNLLLVIVIHN